MAVKKQEPLNILSPENRTLIFKVVGTTPLIHNSVSHHILKDLLMPPEKKNKAAMAASLKHDPYFEFRHSPYLNSNPDADTYTEVLASAFKGAMKGAALDLPGTSKAEIGRLTWVNGERVAIYGDPKLFMNVVRSANINRTPDVRTRAIMSSWAAEVSLTYMHPMLKEPSVINLLAAAGMMSGIGDWRPNKGAGSYGQFKIVADDDPEWNHIVENYGRDHQIQAFENPLCHDDETQKLLDWFDVESNRRGFKAA